MATASDRGRVATLATTNAKFANQLEAAHVAQLKSEIATLKIKIKPIWQGQRSVKLLPLPPPVRARTDARTNPSAQRATQLRSVLARVYAVSIQNQTTTTFP
jgi:hypothetical protein